MKTVDKQGRMVRDSNPPCLASLFKERSYPLLNFPLPNTKNAGKILFPASLWDMGVLYKKKAEGEGLEPPCPCGRRISSP